MGGEVPGKPCWTATVRIAEPVFGHRERVLSLWWSDTSTSGNKLLARRPPARDSLELRAVHLTWCFQLGIGRWPTPVSPPRSQRDFRAGFQLHTELCMNIEVSGRSGAYGVFRF